MKDNHPENVKGSPKPLFDSLLIYLACWCKKQGEQKLEEWKLSDFYGQIDPVSKRFKGIVTGKSRSSMSTITTRRVNRLIKAKVPIKLEEVDPKQKRESQRVIINRQEVIQEFLLDIAFSQDEQEKFQAVIDKAIPLVRIQVDYYIQSQSFANENLRKVIEFYVKIFVEFGDCYDYIKFFPIWLSFQQAITSENGLQQGVKWSNMINACSVIQFRIPQKVNFFLLSKIPNFEEIIPFSLLSLTDLPQSHLQPLERELLNISRRVELTKQDFGSPFFDPNSKDLFHFARISEESIRQVYPDKNQNILEWTKRARIAGEIFSRFLRDLFRYNQLDYEKKIMMLSIVPTIGEGIRAPSSIIDLNRYTDEKMDKKDLDNEYDRKILVIRESLVELMKMVFSVNNIEYSGEIVIKFEIPVKETDKNQKSESRINLKEIVDYQRNMKC
ncbi:MAG: hypothetical protein ACXAC7_23220 [Candidatus Hodarchaeales archaeon]|jgi:hypothetical protein